VGGAAASLAADERLPRALLGCGLEARVCKVESCEGTATVTSSRGVLRHAFDYSFEAEWEVKPLPGGAEGGAEEGAADAADTVYSGRLKYSDVTAAESADVSTTYKKRPSELVAPRVTDALAELKAAVAEAVRGFEAQLRTKSI